MRDTASLRNQTAVGASAAGSSGHLNKVTTMINWLPPKREFKNIMSARNKWKKK
jgi:hypothetical protein